MPTQISREIFRKQLNLTFWAFGHPHSYECNVQRPSVIVGNCNDAGSLERQVLGCPHNVHSELHGTSGTIETPAKNVRAATLSSPAEFRADWHGS
jgi:hypothetical protein